MAERLSGRWLDSQGYCGIRGFDEPQRAERQALQDLRKKLSEAGIDATALNIEGPIIDKLLLEIDRLDIDLVIIGSHAPSFLRDLFFGSTTKEVMRKAPCPVLVLPSTWDERGPI